MSVEAFDDKPYKPRRQDEERLGHLLHPEENAERDKRNEDGRHVHKRPVAQDEDRPSEGACDRCRDACNEGLR